MTVLALGVDHAVGIYIGLLLVATIVALITDRLSALPYTVGLVLVGLAIGLTDFGPNPEDEGFSKELIFFLLLPPLLFQGALHMELNRLMAHFWPIFTFAIIGVTVSVFVLGGVFHLVGGIDALLICMLFGAIMSPTDPVSVLALFKKAGVSHDLRHVVEGESLFNDGTGVVIFGILLTMIESGAGFEAGPAALTFLKVSAGGLVIGVGLGYLTWHVLVRIDDHLVETTLCFILAMGSFWAAESFHLSGVMATVAAGLFIGNHGRRLSMSDRVTQVVDDFFEVLDFLINSILFLLIGLEIRAIRTQGWENILDNLHLVGAGIVALLVARALVVYPLFHVLNFWGTKRPSSWAHVMFWGGLRGSIPIALLLGLPSDMAYRQELVVAGFGVVLFSLVVQGLTIKPLLNVLGLTRVDELPEEAHP